MIFNLKNSKTSHQHKLYKILLNDFNKNHKVWGLNAIRKLLGNLFVVTEDFCEFFKRILSLLNSWYD